MSRTRSWIIGIGAAALLAAACGDEPRAPGPPRRQAAALPAMTAARHRAAPMTPADSARARADLAAWGDSVRAAFARARPLGASEVGELRLDRNAEQIATAMALGMRVSGGAEIQRLVRQRRLVALGDSTTYWVLRDMDHSVPYVIPDARRMLEELGRRFHARLDSLGLPRYRIKVTSALRTDEEQADLRRINSYASRTISAHEFGTTMDVSHERFAAPANPRPGAVVREEVRAMEVELLEEIEKEHAKVLQAELGRAIAEMRDQGLLHVMMENQQPVYHMTLARRWSDPGGGTATREITDRPRTP